MKALMALAMFLLETHRSADAMVTLHPNTFVCNTKATLICNITTYQVGMTWQVNSIRIAECAEHLCDYYPPLGKNYSFSSNTTTGIFNLVIGNITLEDDGDVIACGDSHTSAFTIAKVIVPVEDGDIVKKPVTNEEGYTKPVIQTPCLYPAENLNFTWYSEKNGSAREYYNDGSTTKYICLNDTQCIRANSSARFTSILMKDNLKAADRRKRRSTPVQEERLFYVEIKSDLWSYTSDVGTFIVIDTDNSKPTSEKPSNNSTINYISNKTQNATTNGDNIVIKLGAGIGSVAGVGVVVALCVWCYKRRKNKDKYKSDFKDNAMTKINEDGNIPTTVDSNTVETNTEKIK